MTTFFTTQDGAQIAYDIQGDGPPLLCLAGLTRNMDDFEPVVTHFADRAQIIRMDSRGRGASDFTGAESYTLQQESADVLALLDHLGLARTAILGTSRGGLIAMGLAAVAKPRLSGVLLNDIGPELDGAGLEAIMDYLGLPCPYASFDEAATQLPKVMGARFPNVSKAAWLRYARRVWRQGETGLALRYDPALRDAVLRTRGDDLPDLWPFFDALAGMPIALIRGENSDLLSADCAMRMQQKRPDMPIAQIKDRGHVPFLDEPDSIAAIAQFLDTVRQNT